MRICDHDCFNCKFEDCINDRTYSEKSLYKNRSEQGKLAQREYNKKRRAAAKARGFCIICFQKPATHGFKCYECYLRQKRYDKARSKGKRELWRQSGLCYFCGRQTLPGKKVCADHYALLLKNIERCNQAPATKRAQQKFGHGIGK